ncbi:putative spermidine/putrescine transport system permease protein [Azospirillum brasilense]|uniref:Putative spermidine/putrescine transport system permease protein n=1 Tax=Azospirillum brasilense TaxID=192 RepID=A0A560BC80_AZOBR|nr:ABC transporter permease [Azospirillum brasilense]TWA70196.1 putative spermidine/putrescine transport system permease protein [Azospirillum brasilense]
MNNPLFGSSAAAHRLVTAAAWICYVFLLVPSLIVVPISFGNAGQIEFPPREFSLALYRQFFTDPAWWGSMVQSLFVAVATTALALMLAVPAAYALARSSLPGRGLLRGLFMMPMLVPVIVLGLGLYLQFSDWGLLDTTGGVVLAHVMLTTPYIMISVMSGLQHSDVALETVASIMGASRTTIFFRVVLPQLGPSIAVGALFAFLMSLDEVVVAYFLTGTDSMTLPVKMYSSIRWELTPVLAAVSTLLTVLSLLIALGIIALQRKTEAQS